MTKPPTTKTEALLIDKIATAETLLRDLDLADRVDALRALHLARQTVDSAIMTAVRYAREDAATWDQIGRALDLTRQGAQQRYSG